MILHLSSRRAAREGRSVGPFREDLEGRSGSETGSEVSEIMISGDL